MYRGALGPVAIQQFFSTDGLPLAGGFLQSFLAGTTTPSPLYADAALSTPLANPAPLDAYGRLQFYMSALSYKLTLTDANGVIQPGYPTDGIVSVSLIAATLGQVFSFAGDPTSPVIVTAYPSGATYAACHAGSAIASFDSANLTGTYALEAMLISQGPGSISCSLVNLSDGAPDTPIATVTSSSLVGERKRSTGAIVFGLPGTDRNYGIKTKVTSGSGNAWLSQLVRTS